ncbi:unnamed protein product [Durusdinium trenchii]|uniref:SGNH hydrolase-type esterase domain-containing protein n=1 Tax=Durusdinium trenchii TaxID=1381693 RepID=A0ABP0PXW6_9DINO
MGSKVSTSASAYPASRHLALLGDSTIDNAGWVPRGEPCVTDQVRELEPNVTMCARDGALIAAVRRQSLELPESCTDVVVSVGGNNATAATTTVLGGDVPSSVEEALCRLYTFAQAFEAEFDIEMTELARSIGPSRRLVICSCYNPCFAPFNVTTVSQPVANLALSVLSDAVLRVATRLRAPVIDLRRVMTKVEDFANPIEPSSLGGAKIAAEIVRVVRTHPFECLTSVMFEMAVGHGTSSYKPLLSWYLTPYRPWFRLTSRTFF